MKTPNIFLIIFFGLLFFGAAQAQEQKWFDQNLTMDERAESLINAMTVEEKIGQLMNASPGIPRLGIKPYDWWNECLHGVARNGRATVFPQAIALAATFDEALIKDISTAISDEARAKFNVAQSIENYSQYAGLTFWTPNVNIFRDPRWGRGQETYGEDPFLTSRIGVSFVKGLQGDNPDYLKAAACAKHYVVHSGPEALRHEFNAVVSKKDLWETYMPAFKALVTEAKVETVMGAYNRTNGEACCASPYLLTEVLRNQWNFDGHIVSDCWAIQDIYKDHKLCETPEQAAAMSIKAGLNLNCGDTFEYLPQALEQGLLTEDDLNEALRPLVRSKLRLGLLDPVEANPYNSISTDVVAGEKHVQLARKAAQNAIVLVKNDGVLPLKKDIKTLYVTGPQAANAEVLLGNYFGVSENTVNILDGIVGQVSLGTTINYKYGVLPHGENVNPIDWTTNEAKSADACIAVMGISGLIEGEEGESLASPYKGDREDIGLPQHQVDFLKKIKKDSDKPLIVLITGGSPIAIPEVYDFADAVLYVWYPGQEGGNAVADIIFGNVAPSGRLPFTVPYSVADLPPYEDYDMKGRTYRYMEKEPQFPFGFGLTYTDFAYSDISTVVPKKGNVTVSFTVKNTGDHEADEVTQLYVSSPMAGKGDPFYALRGFKRVHLAPGASTKVEFELPREAFAQINEEGEPVMRKGEYKITVGGASPGARSRALGSAEMLTAQVKPKF